MIRFKFFTILICLCCLSICAQTKNEKEFRISLSEFPDSSQKVIQSVKDKVKRTRFYKEIDGDHESYESKFKYEKHWFSVEFDKNGLLEDIEVTIKEQQLHDSIRSAITAYLNSNFSKYDLIKIQEQYIPEGNINAESFVIQIIENRDTFPSNYEIVVAVKQDKDWLIFEMTFDANGAFLKQRTVIQDSYEYIMY